MEHVRKPFKWHFLRENKIIHFNSNCYEIHFLGTKIDNNPKLDKLWLDIKLPSPSLHLTVTYYHYMHTFTHQLCFQALWVNASIYGSGQEDSAVLLPGFAQLIAKSDNKTAELPWHGSYTSIRVCEWMHVNNNHDFVKWSILISNALMSFCDKELNFPTNYFN